MLLSTIEARLRAEPDTVWDTPVRMWISEGLMEIAAACRAAIDADVDIPAAGLDLPNVDVTGVTAPGPGRRALPEPVDHYQDPTGLLTITHALPPALSGRSARTRYHITGTPLWGGMRSLLQYQGMGRSGTAVVAEDLTITLDAAWTYVELYGPGGPPHGRVLAEGRDYVRTGNSIALEADSGYAAGDTAHLAYWGSTQDTDMAVPEWVVPVLQARLRHTLEAAAVGGSADGIVAAQMGPLRVDLGNTGQQAGTGTAALRPAQADYRRLLIQHGMPVASSG